MPEQAAGGAVILAAGFARRFGSDKRTHPLNADDTLLSATVRRYAGCFDRLVLVLRPGDDALAERAQTASGLPLTIVRCVDAHLGMGHSLAAGAAAAADWDYLFVALGDMPWVRATTLRTLRDRIERAPRNAIIQPVCDGRPGHPVGFRAGHLPALRRLEGDSGARRVLEKAGRSVQRIDVQDSGVLIDLDRPPED